MSTKISIDATVGVAYIQLSKNEIAKSVETEKGIVLDLDEFDVIVGIEILDLASPGSISDIKTAAHLNSADENRLRIQLQSLSRMRLTTDALTEDSKVQVQSNNGQTLESC